MEDTALPPGGLAISSSTTSSKADKLPSEKTEAANAWLQYLSIRRKALVSVNPKGVLDVKAVLEDWRKLSEGEKSYYRELFKIEKEMLGPQYRKRVKKNKEVGRNKEKQGQGVMLLKKFKKKDNIKKVEKIADQEDTIESLLVKLGELDSKIEVVGAENEEWRVKIASARTDLAVQKYILSSKNESFDSFNVKYSDLLAKHSGCYMIKK